MLGDDGPGGALPGFRGLVACWRWSRLRHARPRRRGQPVSGWRARSRSRRRLNQSPHGQLSGARKVMVPARLTRRPGSAMNRAERRNLGPHTGWFAEVKVEGPRAVGRSHEQDLVRSHRDEAPPSRERRRRCATSYACHLLRPCARRERTNAARGHAASRGQGQIEFLAPASSNAGIVIVRRKRHT